MWLPQKAIPAKTRESRPLVIAGATSLTAQPADLRRDSGDHPLRIARWAHHLAAAASAGGDRDVAPPALGRCGDRCLEHATALGGRDPAEAVSLGPWQQADHHDKAVTRDYQRSVRQGIR